MKTLIVPATIDSIRAKVDKSLGLTVSTPELTSAEKAEFMEIQGLNVQLTIKPTDEPSEEMKIDKDLEDKPRHVRLRNVLYVFWEQNRKDEEDFETFYKSRMDKWIDSIKEKLV